MTPNLMITGMCSPMLSSYSRPSPPPDPLPDYFRGLGYNVHDDFSTRDGVCWWEISDNEGLICQIDKGVSIERLREDMAYWYTNPTAVEGVSKGPDYDVRGGSGQRYTELLKRVAQYAPGDKVTFDIKSILKDNEVKFAYVRKGHLYYTIKHGFTYLFPVPLEDIGDATFNTTEKALLFMRYIRKAQEEGSFVRYNV